MLARDDYRDLMAAKVTEGEPAPDFDLPLVSGGQGPFGFEPRELEAAIERALTARPSSS